MGPWIPGRWVWELGVRLPFFPPSSPLFLLGSLADEFPWVATEQLKSTTGPNSAPQTSTPIPGPEDGTTTAYSTNPATILQSGHALVQSNVNLDLNDPNSAGNLYVVAVPASGKMQMFYRASSNNPSCHCSLNKTWISTETFESGIGDTAPVMVQDYWRTQDENTPGGFQLLVVVNGQVQHWQRVNTDITSNPPKAGGK
ncbi:uncharacterized protein K444DRAFT_395002 [Hyaloscypha bicolor E]|uniref:Uncharacterized protein n=1 Tax=Hyaloscypha bicolor E TaxID=1095630 RepID=A0A2J6TC45_9HELO|nr:uncharacterized protein K444DRAFT_395002 [Hyaloscypha bicolor E]PMD60542.1 hypothetical protein K444DRAFT_395002 [Hyaloscypha bicolor E]